MVGFNRAEVQIISCKEQDFPGSNVITAGHMGKNWFFAEQIAPAWF
jgi:hypothetical protein